MALSTVFSGYFRAHSALVGNSLAVGNGSISAVNYTTPVGGTTANFNLNGSRAVFNLDPGSTVIFAELILASQSFTIAPGANITFRTPVSTNTIPYGTLEVGAFGWSICHQDVTALVSAGGAGTYEVDRVNGNIQSLEWYIYAVYTKPSYPFKYIQYSRGIQELSTNNLPLTFIINNVFTPSSGPVQSYILLASTGSDTLDLVSATLNGTTIGNPSVGVWNGQSPYNPSGNIQPGIICFADTNNANIGFLDTTGTFGLANNDPYSGVNPNPNRTWCDITGMDVSNALVNGISSVSARFSTTSAVNAGFFLNVLAFEITAVIPPTKTVDKLFASVGDTLTYTVGIINSASVPYTNVTIIDTIPNGTSFVSNSLTLNGSPILGNPSPPGGVNIGTIPVAGVSTVTFQVLVGNTIPSPNPIVNQALTSFTTGTIMQTLSTSIVNTTITAAIISSSKSAKPYATVGDILTYTISMSNTGNTTARNILFIDTIPNGTAFVPNSLRQDGIVVPGNPSPPGVNLPNAIRAGIISTITFQVTVVSIPTPNPTPNIATEVYSYTVDNSTTPNVVATRSSSTNIASTTINQATIPKPLKSTNIQYGTCGDVITYTISVPNSGNVTATNVVLSDTVPNGTIFVPGSILVNGSSVGGNPSSINIGNIAPGSTVIVSFQVTVQC